jgi:peptide-methionine (R)-S-oxide reductase
MSYEIEHTDDEWRGILSPNAFRILRRAGTEPAFNNEYWDNHADGFYDCGGCDRRLFDSADKFDSGTGWPSFTRPIESEAVETHVDSGFGMARTEVRCARCGGHLGHVFDDGPPPLGTRYCMNSGALAFKPRT